VFFYKKEKYKKPFVKNKNFEHEEAIFCIKRKNMYKRIPVIKDRHPKSTTAVKEKMPFDVIILPELIVMY